MRKPVDRKVRPALPGTLLRELFTFVPPKELLSIRRYFRTPYIRILGDTADTVIQMYPEVLRWEGFNGLLYFYLTDTHDGKPMWETDNGNRRDGICWCSQSQKWVLFTAWNGHLYPKTVHAHTESAILLARRTDADVQFLTPSRPATPTVVKVEDGAGSGQKGRQGTLTYGTVAYVRIADQWRADDHREWNTIALRASKYLRTQPDGAVGNIHECVQRPEPRIPGCLERFRKVSKAYLDPVVH